jgi:N6-L-threonylcarbamoyladenine synthase
VDDAAGEAFDKTAQLLGLGYPGGPALSRLADTGDARRFKLPRPMLHSGDLDFSFSGLKTAVLTLTKKEGDAARADIAASFQAAVVDVLVSKCLAALEQNGLERLVVAGGVGANRALRERLNAETARKGFAVFYPPLELCTDNGAMIAYAGALRLSSRSPGSPKSDLAPMGDGLSQWGEPGVHPSHGTPADGRFGVRPRWELSSLEAA